MNAKVIELNNFSMPIEQYKEVTDRLSTIQSDLATLNSKIDVLANSHGYSKEALDRAFKKIEKLEENNEKLRGRIEAVKNEQSRTAWVPVLVQAVVIALAVVAVKTL